MRHGASADSVEGETFEMVEGQGDPPLSDVGRHQAELVGATPGDLEPFDGLYVSNLQRTAQTAAPLVARSGITPVVDPDLRVSSSASGRAGSCARRLTTATP